jgi:hypothetical protein
MTPTEKIILQKVLTGLESGLRWNGASADWTGYANQMKNAIKNSTQFIETLFQLPENKETPAPSSNTTVGDKSFVEKLDDLLP